MLEAGAFGDVSGWLKAEHMYVPAHRQLWAACLALYERGEAIDMLTVKHELIRRGELEAVGGPFYISQLTNKVASSANVEWHGRIIVQYWVQREVIRIGAEAMRDGYDNTEDAFDLAERTSVMVDKMMEEVARKSSTTLGAVAEEQLGNMDKEKKPVHSTGFERLDNALGGGWSDGDLVIIAGRPGMGKSSFAFSSLLASAQRGHPCAVFSLELGEVKTNARLLSIYTGIPLHKILSGTEPRGKLNTDDLAKIHATHTAFAKLPIYPNFNNGLTISELRSEVGRMVRRYGITAVYIDQLTWITAPERVKDPVGAITRGCKRIALEFDIPIILLHQLSRAVTARKGDNRPELTDLRDSGAAEQDAQVVVFPHRPEYYGTGSDEGGDTKGRADIIIAKNTNGPLDTVALYFDAQCTAFRDSDPNLFSTAPHPHNRTTSAKEETTSDLPF
jgi:replicative DNA helicase